VGTGYFLDRCRFPVDRPRIVLVDLNRDALSHTMGRLARYRPLAVSANALDPLPLPPHSVDSVALNYLLHCVPGDADTKGAALGHAARAVKPTGRVFGATILSGGVRLTARARLLQRVLNATGVFHNDDDHLDGLRAQLERHFAGYTLAVHGCVAVFSAHT
jgi:ubiquinone/menaquinone biosynthesis C-methylase UbiE